MISVMLRKLPRWASVLMLAIVGMLILPTIAHAAATTDVVNLFKYTYGTDRLLYLAAQEIVMWRILSRKQTPVGGRGQWILPVQKANTGVFVGHTEGGAKTTRRAQPASTEATFSLQEFHGIYDISWKMLQDARKDEYSFARAIDFMDESFKRRVYRMLNADLLGYGRGELGILPAADNTNPITVAALPLVDQGMVVDLMDDTDDNAKLTTQSPSIVAAIDVPNRTINIVRFDTGGAVTVTGSASGDYFTAADSVSTSGALHTLGILAWIWGQPGTTSQNPKAVVGNLGGINRSTAGNEFWQASVLANGGTLRPLTEDLMLQGMDLCRERGGVVVTDLVSNLAIIRRYHESLRADTFFALQAVKEFGGKVGIGRDAEAMKSGENSEGETIYNFSGVPWRAEMFMHANKLVGLNREHLFIGHGENEVPRPLSEIFDDMTPFFTTTSNTTFEVVSYWQGDLLCDAPTALVGFDDIAES